MGQRYLETHPWLRFEHQTRQSRLDLKLGEALSKCQHLAGTPLLPSLAQQLAMIYLAKGVAATTAIEGNTLSEDEVGRILDHRHTLPSSQHYLEQEVRNIEAVLTGIAEAAVNDRTPFLLTPDWLKAANAGILRDVPADGHVVPGEFTTTGLVVNNYRGAPPEDVPYLVQRLCEWLNAYLGVVADPTRPEDDRFTHAFLAAVLGHLYIAWIHPFGDGNGRTARALECAILANSGIVPWIAANLLSNHYNLTRTAYYRHLDRAAHTDDGVADFLRYAAEGLVDQLRQQIAQVQSMQTRLAWESFIAERFRSETHGDASRRRRALVLALSPTTPTTPGQLRRLTPELAELYATRSNKTISHDVNALRRLGLIEGSAKAGYRAKVELMAAFIPRTHQIRQP
jgi:Fic family protein